MSDYNEFNDDLDDDKVEGIRGITDEVSKFSYVDMDFPFICLQGNIQMPKHKWIIVSKLVKQVSSDKGISFYIQRGGNIYKAGSLARSQVKALIDIVGLENLFGFYSKDKKLEGDRLYVLA